MSTEYSENLRTFLSKKNNTIPVRVGYSDQSEQVIFIAIFISNRKVTLKEMSIEEHYNEAKQYLKYIKNNLKKSDTWKIQLSITMNFISSKYINEESEKFPKNIKD